MITLGSLFTGIGGFDLAFENAGMKCLWQVEIDKHCQGVLLTHFPKIERFDDVRTVGKQNLKTVNVICGGFPCQDLSVAGKRAGLVGERSGLWHEFARIIDELKPGWVVIENVPGLLSSNKGWDFALILRWLVEHGYGVSWRILDAQYFGVPQRRRRVFIVGSLGNGRSAEVLFESTCLSGNIEKGKQEGKDDTRTFTVRTGKDGGGKGYLEQVSSPMTLGGQPQYLSRLASGNDTAPTICANYGEKWGLGDQEAFSGDYHVLSSGQSNHSIDKNISSPLDSGNEQPILVGIRGNSIGRKPENGCQYGDFFDGDKSDTINATDVHAIATISPNGRADAGALRYGSDAMVWEPRSKDGEPRLDQKTFPPLNTAQGGQRQPMVGVRRLTPTECERLQGFKDGWTGGQADTQRYKQLGNAVAVPVVEWIGKRIVEYDM